MEWADLADLEHELNGGYYCPYLGGWCYEDTCSEICNTCIHYTMFCEYYDKQYEQERKRFFEKFGCYPEEVQ